MPPKEKALAKQLENETARQKKAAEDAEREEAARWGVGAKDSSKAKADEEKEVLKRQKAAEKAALVAQEDAELSGVTRVAKPKKKGKDDFDVLKAALAQQPKTKAQKEAEKKKAEDDERKKKEEEARLAKDARKKAEEEYVQMLAAKGIVANHSDALMVPVNNRLLDADEIDVSGVDAALDTLSVFRGPGKVDDHPERRQKAAYNAYYEQELPLMKNDMPGLKLSQYKERIFDMWKSSPENPRNQVNVSKIPAEDV